MPGLQPGPGQTRKLVVSNGRHAIGQAASKNQPGGLCSWGCMEIHSCTWCKCSQLAVCLSCLLMLQCALKIPYEQISDARRSSRNSFRASKSSRHFAFVLNILALFHVVKPSFLSFLDINTIRLPAPHPAGESHRMLEQLLNFDCS